MEQTAQNRRKHYFIDKGFQSKYVALLVVFILLLGIAGILILALGGQEGADNAARPPDVGHAMIAMLIVIVLFVVFIVWYGVRFSHRVVGPIYAFNRHLNWMREGNYTRDLKLRDKDEFQNLASVFNNMQATLRQRTRDDITIMQYVEGALDEIEEMITRGNIDPNQIKELLKNMHQEMESTRVKNEGYITP